MGIANSQDAIKYDQRVEKKQRRARRFIESQAGEEDEGPGSLNSKVSVVMLEPAATEEGEEGE